MPRPWERYEWVRNEPALESFCITIIVGADEEETLGILGAETDSRVEATFAEAFDVGDPEAGGNDVVQVAAFEGHLLILEPNGWNGVNPETAAELSHAGRYVAFYRNVNATMTVVYAEDGAVVRSFDPLLDEADPGRREEANLPFGDPDTAEMAAFVLLERLTGVALEQDVLLDTAHPTYRRRKQNP